MTDSNLTNSVFTITSSPSELDDHPGFHDWLTDLTDDAMKRLLLEIYRFTNPSHQIDKLAADQGLVKAISNTIRSENEAWLSRVVGKDARSVIELQISEKHRAILSEKQDQIDVLTDRIVNLESDVCVWKDKHQSAIREGDFAVRAEEIRAGKTVQDMERHHAKLSNQLAQMDSQVHAVKLQSLLDSREEARSIVAQEREYLDNLSDGLGRRLESSLNGELKETHRRLDYLEKALDTQLLPAVSNMGVKIDAINADKSLVSSYEKGRQAEDMYHSLLTQALPDYEVDLCRNDPHSMDIKLTRADFPRPSILIDMKNYATNVASKEIRKFHDDIRTNACSGILVSVSSGIATKSHMQMDIVDDRFVAMYICRNERDVDQITVAIKIIHGLDHYFHTQSNDGTTVANSTLEKISEKLRDFDAILCQLKEMNDKQRRLLTSIRLADISHLLDISACPATIESTSQEKNKSNVLSYRQRVLQCLLKRESHQFVDLDSLMVFLENQCESNASKCPNRKTIKEILKKDFQEFYSAKITIHECERKDVVMGFSLRDE